MVALAMSCNNLVECPLHHLLGVVTDGMVVAEVVKGAMAAVIAPTSLFSCLVLSFHVQNDGFVELMG